MHNPKQWWTSFGSAAVVAVVTALALIWVQNIVVGQAAVRRPRFATDFSPVFLQRELARLASQPRQTLFLGDSVLWGYQLQPDQTAIALLAAQGCACRNLAFKAGTPPNFYAMVRLMQQSGVHPQAVVLEINQRAFNAEDRSYRTLHPALAALAKPLFAAGDWAKLTTPAPEPSLPEPLESALSSSWLLYGMRADVRAMLFGEGDSTPTQPITPDLFLGTYDLTPLTSKNVAVYFLERTARLLQSAHVRTVAFLTPTNHKLLHDYIDDPAYYANGRYLESLMARHGVSVVDLDRALPSEEFIDNDHLTPRGQRRLARFLADMLRREGIFLPDGKADAPQ